MQDPIKAMPDEKKSRFNPLCGALSGRKRSEGWLARLARDQKGNTLAMVGAALLPLTAMIGSGVDMSRAYMAKHRLQTACDAAALAGRRAMVNDTLSSTVTSEATKFFNFNFPQGSYSTQAFTPSVTRPSTGVVQVSASTRIPTSIMKVWGWQTLPLDVTCNASLNFVNTDVVLVLDVTGSMAQSLAGTPKIDSLKDAVMALYDALAPVQTQLAANGLRLRYGVVPYSSTVNVGGLIRGVNPAYIADNVEYQTRVANYSTPTYIGTPGTPQPPVEEIYGSSISQSDCDLYGQNKNFGSFNKSAATGGGPPPATTWARAFSNNEAAGTDWGWPGAADTTTNKRSCRRRYVETDTTYITDYTFTNYSYEPESVDVSQFKLGNPVRIATANDGRVDIAALKDPLELAADGIGVSSASVTWSGCIEERQTVSSITPASGYTIPSTAFDLDVNLIPTTDAQRWRPMWDDIEYVRAAGSASAAAGVSMNGTACPAAARRLASWTRGDLQTYINTLTPTGSTYHDIGMIWGARLISTGGIFADACDTYNGMPCSRHIIFMTDGQLDTDNGIYSAYGIERNDMRVSGMSAPSETELNGRHMQRFKMMCNAIKGMNTSIWVIAFGTTLSPEMTECASNANQASTIGNRDALIAKEIGNNIGALRLTQ
jgi:Flp pilus assembly protein TadG